MVAKDLKKRLVRARHQLAVLNDLLSKATKVSKESVDYKLGGPHCHACKYYIEDLSEDVTDGTCQKVQGPIGEHMVCDLFERSNMK